jgi:tyrosine-protein phosphatase non-receptor type 23
MPFSWTDTFSGKSVSVSDIAYEQASILFNLGCLHSQLGDYDDRTTDEGMRVSCTHFQCAAGAFDHVKEHFASVSSTPDLGSEMMAFLTSLMLGQAQECMLEKAMHDGKKGNITSRLAWQVSNYYSTSLLLTESQTIEKVVGKRAKSWQKHCKAKMLYFMSLAQMFASTASADQNKGGERVAYLKLASSNIADALKLVKVNSFQPKLYGGCVLGELVVLLPRMNQK